MNATCWGCWLGILVGASCASFGQNAPEKPDAERTQFLSRGLTLDLAPRVKPGTGVRASGPLADLFSKEKPGSATTRLLGLFNPFAPVVTSASLHRTTDSRLSARPWSSTVGWSPGQSAFPDVRTHEASLTLVKVGR